MAIEYDDISLKITSKLDANSIDKAVDSLEKATDQVEEFAKAVDSVDGNKIPQYIQDIAKKATSRWKKASTPDWEMDWNRETTWKDSLSPVEDATKSMQNYMKATEESTSDAYDELKAYLELFPKTKDSYLKNQMGFSPDTIAHVRQDMYMTAEETKRMEKEAKDAQKAFQEMASATRNLNDNVVKVTNPMAKLANRFKSFLQYRAMRAVWSAFTNGVKEGVKNLEDWDRNIGHTGFADAMDRARDSVLTLKNALAVIVAPGLEWISGVLQKIAQWAIVAANTISRFFAILGGKSSYRAVQYAEGISAAEKSAAGSAKAATKEFKKQLMAFDEINNITAQNDGGSGGGGGGGSSVSYKDMFEDVPLDTLSNFEQRLKNVGEAIRLGAAETQRSLNQRAEEFKRMWGNLLNDTGQWWEDWTRKLNVSWQVLANNMKLISSASIKFQKGDFEGAMEDIKQIFTGDMHEYEVAVQLYGEEWANTHYGIRTDFSKTADEWDKSVSRMTKLTKDQAPRIGREISGNITERLKEANQKGEETGGVFKSISDFAKKWLLPANINDPLVTPLKESKTWADKVKEALKGLSGTYDITINTTENVTRTITEVAAKVGGVGSKQTYQWKAGGGFVSTGQMFIAREAGPELVGTIGSHTAVANNDQIVAAVSQGVASAVASVMGGSQQVNVTLEGDAKGIFKVVQKEGRAYSARTGQPALA